MTPAPHNHTPHRQAGYGLLTALLVILLAAIIALEFGTDLFERMGGNLMKWTNANRQRLGRAWEDQSVSMSAMQEMEEIIARQEETRRELHTLSDFTKLPQQLAEGKLLTISRERFVELYERIPYIFSAKLGSPLDLMELKIVSSWNRTAFIGRNNGLDIYFINNENYVLQKLVIDEEFFKWMERWGVELPGNLELNPDYQDRIFTAAEFVRALSQMEDADKYFTLGKELLNNRGSLIKVGISRRWHQEMVEMAFQYAESGTIVYSVDNRFALLLLEYLPDKAF